MQHLLSGWWLHILASSYLPWRGWHPGVLGGVPSILIILCREGGARNILTLLIKCWLCSEYGFDELFWRPGEDERKEEHPKAILNTEVWHSIPGIGIQTEELNQESVHADGRVFMPLNTFEFSGPISLVWAAPIRAMIDDLKKTVMIWTPAVLQEETSEEKGLPEKKREIASKRDIRHCLPHCNSQMLSIIAGAVISKLAATL